MTELENLSPEEQQLLEEAMKSYGAPQPDEKHNVHTFLNKVAISNDTTKTGNLTSEEIGFTPYSLRTYKQLALTSNALCNDELWGDYFMKKGEILTSTSLSKDAKLISLAVVQRRELADMTKKPMTQNKGWFKKGNKEAGEGENAGQ